MTDTSTGYDPEDDNQDRIYDLSAAISTAISGIDDEHHRLDGDRGCFTCWPGEDSWPCYMAMIANELREVLK